MSTNTALTEGKGNIRQFYRCVVVALITAGNNIINKCNNSSAEITDEFKILNAI